MNTDVSESHSQEIACENEGSIKIVSETKKKNLPQAEQTYVEHKK